MALELKSNDVYGLITQLCERLIEKHWSVEDNLYLPQKNCSNIIKKLRAKAFGVLLNKSNHALQNDCEYDPIAELLKFAFKLKVDLGLNSQAKKLENLVDELIDNKSDTDSVICSTLVLLSELKETQYEDEKSLNIFHYGKVNPYLPEGLQNENEVSTFQVYPLECCTLPEKFEEILGVNHDSIIRDSVAHPGSKLLFLNQFTSSTNVDIQSVSQSRPVSAVGTSSCFNTFSPVTGFTMGSYFLSRVKADPTASRENFYSCIEGIVTESESPWQYSEQLADIQSASEFWDDQISNHSYLNGNDNFNSLVIWEGVHKQPAVENARTWETLGMRESKKEPPFLSECNAAVLHLAKLKQAGILPLLSERVLYSTPLITEVPTISFLKDVKLLLLGIESNSFYYDSVERFNLQKNLTVCGISPESLENICYEIIHWGSCFKALTNLVSPDPDTGKLQIEGLIFKAMCDSLKEFLLYYQAAILQIPVNEDEKMGLLMLLNAVRPLGFLIVEVAELCQCNGLEKTSLGEGIGILTHIYEQVTKVTKPNVAFIFYSILKSCCEVYFRFLRKWLFEGICEDVYGEFMIRVKPHYLRLKERKFWTRAFTINTQSVPGFLKGLSESILQCGKTVRLLKICDPKNAVCYVSSTCQPPVRVCLSTNMLHEQLRFCNEYKQNGNEALGSVDSLWTAIQEQKAEEKERANLVIMAQQGTLLRLKKEKEENLKKIAKEKCEYLKKLKIQAEEVALRKMQDRNAELLADKLLIENITREEEEAKYLEKEEKAKTLKYYNELAAEAKRQRARTDWRLRRMNLFDERVEMILSTKKELWSSIDELNMISSPVSVEHEKIDTSKSSKNDESIPNATNIEKPDLAVNAPNKNILKAQKETHKDENSNPANKEFKPLSKSSPKNLIQNPQIDKNEESQEKKKAVRPTVLEIKSKIQVPVFKERKSEEIISLTNQETTSKTSSLTNSTLKTSNFAQSSTEFLTEISESETKKKFLELREVTLAEAQRNKIRVMQHEYGLITPNNNEPTIRFSEEETANANFIPSLTELQINRLRNTQHQIGNWDSMEIIKRSETPMENMTEAQRNKLRNTLHRTEQGSFDKLKKTVTVMGQEHVIEEMKDSNMEVQSIGLQTPMSCVTDYFTSSMNSSSIQMQSCENTPYSEISSDMQMPVTSDETVDSKSILESRLNYLQGKIKHPDFVGFSTNATTPTFESSLTVVDVEMLDTTSLAVYLEKSVMAPLRVQCKLANNAMVKYLLQEHNIISHLHSLRDYFFLLNGEFAKSLTHSLFTRLYEVSTPFELFNSTTLKSILDRAIVNSLSSSYTNSELLSLSATGLPNHLQVSNPEALDCLLLNYKMSWPLNIIFDEVVMVQYTKVFKFLLMVGRVLWVLEEDFHILKTERQAATSEQYHKIQLYRHSMMQFINALHTYLTCSVLHASWAEFEKDLEDATTLDEVYLIHVSYIKKILSRCMLYKKDEKMRECLRNIFTVVLKFHNQIRSRKWVRDSTGYIHPNYAKIENMYKSFCKLRIFMAHVASKLANSGYQPHLTHFLHALNINHLYDITSNKG